MADLSPSPQRPTYQSYFAPNAYAPVPAGYELPPTSTPQGAHASAPAVYDLPPNSTSQDAFLSPPLSSASTITPSMTHKRTGSSSASFSSQRILLQNQEHEHHQSALIRVLEYFVPLLGTLVLTSGVALLSGLSSDSAIIAPLFVQQLGLSNPKLWTAIFTVISTLLSATLSSCHAMVVRIVIRKFAVARSHRLKTLAGWITLRNGSLIIMNPGWFLVTFVHILLVGVLTTCINTIISPNPWPIPLATSTAEADLASDAFRQWYMTNGSITQCNWWVAYRDGLQPTCVVGNSLPAMLDTGRAAVDANLLGDTGYTSFGKTIFSGTTGGVLPIDPEMVRANVGNLMPSQQLAVQNNLWNYTLGMQGLSAQVACTNDSVSPLSYNMNTTVPLATGLQVMGTCACGDQQPVAMVVGGDWVQAAVCPGQIKDSWNFYLRHYGAYAMSGVENLTCTISPYLVSATATYIGTMDQHLISNLNPISVPDTSIFGPMIALLPQAVLLGQNTQNNIVLESVKAVMNAFYAGKNYAVWYPHVWESYLKGWMEYVGTSVRLQYTSTQPALSSPVSGQVTLLLFAWQFSSIDYLFLTPLVIMTLLTVSLALWAMFYLRNTRLPTFDPTDTISLVTASAWCDEGLKEELEQARDKGCDSWDRKARDVRVAFRGGGLAKARKS
ncbi:hypothetical protein DACRYDRAFT_19036 [Dacryopinax primogenitus]|uniref:Uncharacterized protein n=1 Tax=Dacryopinax primogenitus (strain DJM 731) TaxID=1858805 RepID=M5FZQ5_DACPD|nr:uncharacterized protein DACRYDRAFT_19036 [Dacryopinax primogenitus]EJT96992.1 hypothetical protein DACRYDRAFT_19036 [Dacryopinax primogenitus]